MGLILLTGASGFLGSFLEAELRRREIKFVTAGRRSADVELDLADAKSVAAALASSGATMVCNAGACSTLAGCAADPARAHRVNGTAVAALAGSGIRLLQISTDQVFCGREAPYLHTACPDPAHVYGQSKLAGENAALLAGGLVIRLPLLFGRLGGSTRGATGMLRQSLIDGTALRLFCDEYRTPLHAGDAASCLIDLLLQRDLTGVHHLAGPERVSRWEFGQRFLSAQGMSTLQWQAATRADRNRPKDVSLISDWPSRRSLDVALAES